MVPSRPENAERYPLLCRAMTLWEMNFYRPRCARTCPEAYASIVHACLRSNPRARPEAASVNSLLTCMCYSTTPSDPQVHQSLEVPAHQGAGSYGVHVGAETLNGAPQAQRHAAHHDAGSDEIDGDVQRLLEACDLADGRHESRETWYHPDGPPEEGGRREGDTRPRFPSGKSHGESEHYVERASQGVATGSPGVGCCVLS